MSSIINNYIPSEGIMVFSDTEYQRVTSVYSGGFNYRSRTDSDIIPFNKHNVDSCWETGNIYYTQNNNVYKVKYDGELIASMETCNATSIAVSQALLPMETDPDQFREDEGCWIVENLRKQLIKTDNQLNVVSTITNLSSPMLVISSDYDGGCYLFDDGLQWIIKIDSSSQVVTYMPYSSVSPSFVSATQVKRAIVDHTGNLWILMGILVYKVILSNGRLYLSATLNPLQRIGLNPLSSTVNDFDIDRNPSSPSIYIVGGCSYRAWITNYSLNTSLLGFKASMDIAYPVAVKVTQYAGSTGIYIITESDSQYLPVECESSTSSTSSSSSEGYSQSTPSSNSSTSSSSFGLPCCAEWEIHFPWPIYDSIFPLITINGLVTRYSPLCKVWAEFYTSGSAPVVQTVNIYNSAVKSTMSLIATGSLATNVTGDIPLSAFGGSGVTGSVSWYESPPGTHPSTINWPNSLFAITCTESSSSSSSVSTSSSSSLGITSVSSSSGQVYDCTEDLICGTPINGSSNACADLSSWIVNGITNVNSKNGSFVVQVYHAGPVDETAPQTYVLDIYKADTLDTNPPYAPIGAKVATSGTFSCGGIGPIIVTFSQYNGSGLSGSVIWSGYTGSEINESYTLITCGIEKSSSSSSQSMGMGTFTATGFDSYPEANGQYYYWKMGSYGAPVYINNTGSYMSFDGSWGVMAWKILGDRYIGGNDAFHPEGHYRIWIGVGNDPNAIVVRN